MRWTTRWTRRLLLIGVLGAIALGLPGMAVAAARIDGTVLDCHSNPLANFPVTLSPGWTRYTASNGYFYFVPETPGSYYVTVGTETRGPYWYAGLTGPSVHTGTWVVPCPPNPCRPPCEISDPGPPGPTAAQQSGDDDTPNVTPGDDDQPTGPKRAAAGDDDTPNVTPGDDDMPNGRAARIVAIQGAMPNPFSSTVRLMLNIAAGGTEVSGRIFDIRGRQVRSLPASRMSAGQQAVTWDGRDDAGARVRAGVYFVQIAAPGSRSGIIRVAFMP